LEGKDKFGLNGMETSLYKFDLIAFQREPNEPAVNLGSLAPDNMRQINRNLPERAENEQAQSLLLRHFYNGLRRKTNLVEMPWKQACTNLISEHFSGNRILLQLV